MDPPLIFGVIKLENLRLKKIQRLFCLRKAWHRVGIDVHVHTNIFTAEVSSLFCLINCAILQDSCKIVRR
jgi:hypothetical protein